MKLYVERTTTGDVLTLDVEASDTIENIKQKITVQIFVPSHRQKLIFSGQVLEDGRTLADYKIQRKQIIKLVLKSAPRTQSYPSKRRYRSAPRAGLFGNRFVALKPSAVSYK